MPRTRHQLGHVLQVAQQIRRHGCVDDVPAQGAAGREPAAEEDVRRRAAERRPAEGSALKKMVRPSQRREMARTAIEGGRTNIRHACRTFELSETCYRYQATSSDENARIADWLVRLTTAYRDWGSGLCFLHLRNVKGFGWNHKRVYRIYRELELNLRIKPKKRLVREKPEPLAVPDTIN